MTLDGSWCTTPECLWRADLWIHVVRANGRQKPLRNHMNRCHKIFSSYRRSSENDSSLPLFFPTDERDCTKDFYSVNVKIYKMSASPQQQTSQWKWKWRNDRRSKRNLCNCVKKPEKNPGLQRGLNPWPRDTSAMLYQLSYEATDIAFTATIISSFSLFHFISAVHIWFISYIINKPMSGAGSPSCRPGHGSVQLNL